MRISDWSSDVCSSDLGARLKDIGDDEPDDQREGREEEEIGEGLERQPPERLALADRRDAGRHGEEDHRRDDHLDQLDEAVADGLQLDRAVGPIMADQDAGGDRGEHLDIQVRPRSEEHTSELQSLMRISYAVFCLKKKKT